jgi:transaldolase
VAQPAFVNVFMGRLNAFVADNALGDGVNVGEKATLASQRELLALRAAGRSPSRLIGASMRDGSQVGTLAGVDVFTMPPKVAAAYRESPSPSVTSQLSLDPIVSLSPGIALSNFAGQTLWEVPAAFRACAGKLARLDGGQLTPEALVDQLAHAGFGDLFPPWSEADRHRATADGKIPNYRHWQDRLAAGEVGLDALMNFSAYHSFVEDQAALDARIAANMG